MSLSWFISKLNGSWWCSHCGKITHVNERISRNRSRRRPAPHPTSCNEDATCSPVTARFVHGTRESRMKGVALKKKDKTHGFSCVSVSIYVLSVETFWSIIWWQSHIIFWNRLSVRILGKKEMFQPAGVDSIIPAKFLNLCMAVQICPVMFDIGFNNGEIETWPALFWWDLNFPYFSYLLYGLHNHATNLEDHQEDFRLGCCLVFLVPSSPATVESRCSRGYALK